MNRAPVPCVSDSQSALKITRSLTLQRRRVLIRPRKSLRWSSKAWKVIRTRKSTHLRK
ncbi:hypothetical protein BDW67DRAFT_164026 [Aspergillus spinulosporus]